MWFVGAARGRKGMPMSSRLSLEIVDAFNNTGTAVKKREDTHKMADIQIPTKQIEIHELACTQIEKIPLSTFASFAVDGVSKVHGEFRQKEIISQWQKYTHDNTDYYSADFFIRCSSGTYVRGIVHDLGKRLHTGALAYNIIRTKVGNFSLLPKSYSFTA
jgi:tRNA U55 pseudouridine synthase TruB